MAAPTLDESETARRPGSPRAARLWRLGIFAVIAIGLVWSISGLEISVDRLLSAPGEAWDIVRLMWPPAFQTEIERGVLGKVFESVYIAWIGTLIAATLSLPLAFAAARNVAPRPLRIVVRLLFNIIRTVPELIVAVILLGVTGLGPWAGALAIGLDSVGTLGKLSSEEIENVDQGPIEAVEAAGGREVSAMRWAVLPEALPIIVSYWLFRFEINVRVSAVLGMIGAGGVGSELVQQLNFRNFPEVGAVLAITVAVVLIIDTISGAVRRRIIRGGTGLPIEDEPYRTAEALSDLTGLRSPRP